MVDSRCLWVRSTIAPVTAHRKNGTGATRPVLSLGTRKPRAAASDTAAAGAKTGPTIKIKRAARAGTEAPARPAPARPARRLAPALAGAPPPPAALKTRRAAPKPALKPALKTASKAAPAAAPAAVPKPRTPPPAPLPEDLSQPALSERQRRHLRGLAHALKPLVRLGAAGLTPAVAKETSRALTDHELIKVKAQAPDRRGRDALLEELARLTGSALVHRIGHMGVLYRPRPGVPKILIPD